MNKRYEEMCKSLLAWWKKASRAEVVEGALWYDHAHRVCWELSYRWKCPLSLVCGVVAALSPGVKWDICVKQAARVVEAAYASMDLTDRVVTSTYASQREKARTIALMGEEATVRKVLRVLSQRDHVKTRAFFLSLMKPGCGAIVVDTWMLRAAGASEICHRKPYLTVARAIRQVARDVHVAPHEFQATVWLVVRRVAEQGELAPY